MLSKKKLKPSQLVQSKALEYSGYHQCICCICCEAAAAAATVGATKGLRLLNKLGKDQSVLDAVLATLSFRPMAAAKPQQTGNLIVLL
jgi:hypothetical protein